MQIISLYNPNHPKITPLDLVTKARALMRDWGVRFLPVVMKNRLEGVISRVEVLNLTSTKSNIMVRNIMVEPKVVLTPGSNVENSTLSMIEVDEWYAPVVRSVESKEYLGVYGLDDFLAYYYNVNLKIYNEPVSKIMTTKVITLNPLEPVHSIWHKMLKYKYAGFPVVDNNRVIGVVTQHDLIKYGFVRFSRESERSKSVHEVTARDIMTTPAVTAYENTKILKVVRLMVERGVGRVIITDFSGKLKGIVDREDVTRAILSSMS